MNNPHHARFAPTGGAPRRASQRRHHPATATLAKAAPRRHVAAAPAPIIKSGDPVTWNAAYRGVVQRVIGTEAIVVEHDSPLLRRTLLHVIRLDALTRA
jgi:hypothetical protein